MILRQARALNDFSGCRACIRARTGCKSRSATARGGVANVFSRKRFVTRRFTAIIRATGNRTRTTRPPALRTTTILQPGFGPLKSEILCRGAGNRTRSTRTRIVRTTGILHPDIFALPTDKAGAPCRIRTYDLSNMNRML